MYKWIGIMLLICMFIFSGCMNSAAYKDEDIAAIVRGEEITVGELRFLYPDDAIEETVDGVVKAKLAEQEAKRMDIDISEQIKEVEGSYGNYPQDDLNSPKADSIRSFAKPQAKKLGMNPKEYYEEYTEVSATMTAYVNAYTSVILGGIEDDEFGIEEYNQHANEVLDNLIDLNKDAIEIRVK